MILSLLIAALAIFAVDRACRSDHPDPPPEDDPLSDRPADGWHEPDSDPDA